jgi:hypothetical protein
VWKRAGVDTAATSLSNLDVSMRHARREGLEVLLQITSEELKDEVEAAVSKHDVQQPDASRTTAMVTQPNGEKTHGGKRVWVASHGDTNARRTSRRWGGAAPSGQKFRVWPSAAHPRSRSPDG